MQILAPCQLVVSQVQEVVWITQLNITEFVMNLTRKRLQEEIAQVYYTNSIYKVLSSKSLTMLFI